MKVVVDCASDRVVGVHVLGHDAGEIIQAVGIAVTMGATKADFDRTIAVHPDGRRGTRHDAQPRGDEAPRGRRLELSG